MVDTCYLACRENLSLESSPKLIPPCLSGRATSVTSEIYLASTLVHVCLHGNQSIQVKGNLLNLWLLIMHL